MTYPKGTIVRYAVASRINHWLTGLCFVLLVLSGLSMFHPLLFFFSNLFGGGQWTRAVHPWIGVMLLLSYSGLIVQFGRDEMWTQDDFAWAKAINSIVVNKEEGVPEVARFNAGQKFVFWAMALLVPILFFSGVVIWEIYFSSYTTIERQRVALWIHSLAAIVAIIVWIIHVYAGLWIRGSMRAMTQGYVTPGWAYRHHRKWFRRLVERRSRGPVPNADAVSPRKSP
jgi:formate dehydrogenase subunit gamma